MNKIILALGLMTICAAARAQERFDRSALLPELAKAAKSAQSALGEYRQAKKVAEEAAHRLSVGYRSLPANQRHEAKARDLVQLEGSLQTVEERLGTFHDTMRDIEDKMNRGIVGGVVGARQKLGQLVDEAKAEVGTKERALAGIGRLASINPDALSEADAQRLNSASADLAQWRGLEKSMGERQGRIGVIQEAILKKIGKISEVTKKVESRIAQVQAERTLVGAEKGLHTAELVAEQLDLDDNSELSSTVGRALDSFGGEGERRGGGNERQRARAWLKDAANQSEGGLR